MAPAEDAPIDVSKFPQRPASVVKREVDQALDRADLLTPAEVGHSTPLSRPWNAVW